jgi:hypothetical protein
MSKVDILLNWLIIILGLVLVVLLFVLPKDHCDTCNFDGLTGKKWFGSYSDKCLEKYSIGEENPNVPELNLSNLQPYYSYP